MFGVAVSILVLAVFAARACRKPGPIRNPSPVSSPARITWPAGIKAAVSISFDHSTQSQLEKGIPILDRHGIKASFYPDIPELKKRLTGWRKAAVAGHEIGNHSLHHPCSAGFRFERKRGEKYALEGESLESVEGDIMEANAELTEIFGKVPRTFAYPCGEIFVGRGAESRSYVPVVARHFIAGRGFNLDFSNDPAACDLMKVNALAVDGWSYASFIRAIEQAAKSGDWVVFCGHGVEPRGGKYPAISPVELEKVCAWLEQHKGEIWTGTVAEVAEYITENRGKTGGKRGL